jgi:pimeloyl-ACP methyl ester carboxylesterase
MTELTPSTVPWRHATILVNKVEIHYAEAGSGEPVLLLPGWPQTWYAWRKVAPRLIAHGRRVIAIDPRGVGRSGKPECGYTLVEAATDIHDLIRTLGLSAGSGVDVLSYDLGSAIAYALASLWPADVRRLVVCELTIPRPGQKQPLPSEQINLRSWHFGFNRLPGLPEQLVAGRERLYLDYLWGTKAVRPDAIEEDARREYAEAFAQPGAAKASFDYYRESFSDAGIQQLAEWLAKPLPMPVLAIGADGGVGPLLAASLADSAADLRSVLVKNCGHFVPEEDPDFFVQAVLDFWAATDRT